nr:MAG TPA: hypothetical protein [Crassvirales sp.]
MVIITLLFQDKCISSSSIMSSIITTYSISFAYFYCLVSISKCPCRLQT